MSKRNHWYDYLWVLTALYLALGFFNILFAWLGLLCFFIPLIMASTFGTKSYCNKYCGRGQLFELIGNSWKLSPKRDIPSWMRSHTFRYGFLLFFTTMFVNMLVSTYLVFTHAIYFHKTACCGLLTYHGTGLTAAVRSHGSRNLLLDFTASC
ncbi:MAG: hypothetical protein Q3X26_06340 [Phascolarctobacterium sp.]|nr:hypothetical protein [Phascolarctobacterium sp.]